MRVLVLLALLGCGRPCPKCPTPPPVTAIVPRVPCRLPALPGPLAGSVGYPAPDGQSIFVSRGDWAALGGYLAMINSWIVAAQDCMETP